MQNWYALHTKPHKEQQVASFLNERGIEIFYPTLPVSSPSSAHRERAFFTSYLFAHVDLETTGLWPLHYAPGMRGVVMFGGTPAVIEDKIVAFLRARLAQKDIFDGHGQVLTRGDRVRITSGPLADWDAVFDQRLSADGRVRVLIQLLHRWTKVEMNAAELRKIGAMPRSDLFTSSVI